MKVSLEKFVKDLNTSLKENEFERILNGPDENELYIDTLYTINLEVLICPSVMPENFDSKKSYDEEIKDATIFFERLIREYHRNFGIEFRPRIHEWKYDRIFTETISKTKEGKIPPEEKQAYCSEYETWDELYKRTNDILMLYYLTQDRIYEPTIFCGIFGYEGSTNKKPVLGGATKGFPFMVVSKTKTSKDFWKVFRHELNHCLGAKHNYIFSSIMYPKVNSSQTGLISPANKRRIKRTLEESYSEPFKIRTKS